MTSPAPASAAGRAPGGVFWGLAFLAGASAYAAVLIWHPGPGAAVDRGLLFNDMLLHLLAGRFDVSPGIVGGEGFLRDGLVYSYFGPLPALLRLAAMPFCDLRDTDLTVLACWLATCGALALQLASLRLVWRRAAPSAARDLIGLALLLTTLFGGPLLPFLKPTIYQEVLDWANLCSSGFVLLALGGLLGPGGFSRGRLAAMAAIAGACLLTRVSTAIGLYAALGLLLLALAGAPWRVGFDRRCGPAAFILLGFALLAGAVNQARWGNPLIFANLDLYIFNSAYPDRLPRLHRYGEFNPARIPFGLIYYFVPIWTLPGAFGEWLRAAMQRLMDAFELPPASMLLAAPAMLLLAGRLGRRDGSRDGGRPGVFDRWQAAGLLAGLAAPGLLMLMAISMTFRYRLEFYPFFQLAALLQMARTGAAARPASRGLWLGLALLGVVFGIVELASYRAAADGPIVLRTP